VGQDHASKLSSPAQELMVGVAAESLLQHGDDVLADRSEGLHHLRVNVLVREKRKIEGIHAEIFTSQTISFFSAFAA